MESSDAISVAEYVRMSTEDQKYSIPNQQDAIRKYASHHGFYVCRTYADPGKSGVLLRHREGLSQLLQDVVGGRANYKAVLVYDVSRWGRFQNPDEAAHYEFVCTSAGIPVHYCAEQFPNDGSIHSSLMKALKRTMAAEFSRELGVKVFDGLKRLVSNGFHAGGQAPYGLRRMLVSESGRKKGALKLGELKNLKTDKVILVRGDVREVRRVRQIFAMAADQRMNSWEIAEALNSQHVPYRKKKRWDNDIVLQILRRLEYTGVNVWGRRLENAKRPTRQQPRTAWVVSKAWFKPIIDQATFDAAQLTLRKARSIRYTEEHLLKTLKRLLARKGKLSANIIDKALGVGYYSTVVRHFGSIFNAYEIVGYQPEPVFVRSAAIIGKVRVLHKETLRRIQGSFPAHIRIEMLGRRQKGSLLVDERIRVEVFLCGRHPKFPHSSNVWKLRSSGQERQRLAVLCLLDKDWEHVEEYWVIPPLCDSIRDHHTIHRDDILFTKIGEKLTNLSDFYRVLRLVMLSNATDSPCH